MRLVPSVMQGSDRPTEMVRWRTPGTELRLDLPQRRVIGRLLSLDEDGLSVRSIDSDEVVSARWSHVDRISVLDRSPHPWWIVLLLATLGVVVFGGGALFIAGLGRIGRANGDLPPGSRAFIMRALLMGLGSGMGLGLLIALIVGGEYWLTVYSGADSPQVVDGGQPLSLHESIEGGDARAPVAAAPLDARQMLKWLLFGLVLLLVFKVCAP